LGSKVKEEKETNVNWIPLNSLEQIKTIKELSKSETILVFKHSTRCGISSMVIKRFENLFDSSMNNIKVYYLDLLNFRAISDEVGYSFQAQHQSPQLLIIRNEVAVLNVSHYDITTVNIQKYL
jgi:bacillithiol system protein YtxJ